MSIIYTKAFTFVPDAENITRLPTGCMLLSAAWDTAHGPGSIEVHYMHTRPVHQVTANEGEVKEAALCSKTHAVYEFHVCRVGQDLPEGPAWCIPVKLDSVHYLFYAIRP